MYITLHQSICHLSICLSISALDIVSAAYCESNFQLLDDKEYWTFIFLFNLKDCLLPYLVLCCLTNVCQTKSKFMFYYHSAY